MSKAYIILLSFMLFLSAQFTYGQVSGFQGKHFVLKTDLSSTFLLGKGFNVELERVMFRHQTFSLELAHRAKTFRDPYFVGKEFAMDTTVFTDNTLTLKLRSYANKAIPAPQGGYKFYHLRIGTTNIERSKVINRNQQPMLRSTEVKNKIFYQLAAGYGYQEVIGGIAVIDISFAAVISRTEVPNKDLAGIVDLLPIHGGNLANLTREVTIWGRTNIGVSVTASLGVLIY